MRSVVCLSVLLLIVGCATPPAPFPVVRPGEPFDEAAWVKARNDRMWRAAMDCRGPGIELELIRPDGTLQYTYREQEDLRAFDRCYDARIEALLLGAPGRLAQGAPGTASVPVEPKDGSLLVVASVDGVPGRFILDTGAAKTIVKPSLADRAGLVVRREDLPIRIVVADGRVIAVPLARTRLLGLGGTAVADLDVGVYDVVPDEPSVDGLLGEDFLRFYSVRLDRQARRLVLEAAR